MTKVILAGEMGRLFGPEHNFEVSNIREIFNALLANYKGFRKYCVENRFKIIRGNTEITNIENLKISAGPVVRIVPIIEGSGGGNSQAIGKTIVGIALVGLSGGASAALGGLVSSATVARIGTSIAIRGVSALISGPPKSQLEGNEGAMESPADKPSFIFRGPQNTVEQGAVIPLIYGEVITGSVTVSAGTYTEEVQ
jgi:predicted phage tail protein